MCCHKQANVNPYTQKVRCSQFDIHLFRKMDAYIPPRAFRELYTQIDSFYALLFINAPKRNLLVYMMPDACPSAKHEKDLIPFLLFGFILEKKVR
jgi:hypothetical protein